MRTLESGMRTIRARKDGTEYPYSACICIPYIRTRPHQPTLDRTTLLNLNTKYEMDHANYLRHSIRLPNFLSDALKIPLTFPFVNSIAAALGRSPHKEQQQADSLIAFVIHRPLAPSCSGIWAFLARVTPNCPAAQLRGRCSVLNLTDDTLRNNRHRAHSSRSASQHPPLYRAHGCGFDKLVFLWCGAARL